MALPMNRAERRKVGAHVLKLRQESVVKKQWGIGLVITNLIFTITFWRWTLVVYDRRLSK